MGLLFSQNQKAGGQGLLAFIRQLDSVRVDGSAVLLAFPSMSLDGFHSSTFKARIRKKRQGQHLCQENTHFPKESMH